MRAAAKESYENNKERHLANSKAWVARNKERVREIKQAYKERNRETERAYFRYRRKHMREESREVQERYRKSHMALYADASARRRAAILQALPVWADLDAIASVYAEAELRSLTLDVQYEVDHIVPLQGEAVCGLHVEYNLQIVPVSVNRAKSNKLLESEP